MPELPEVETVRRGLEPYLTGARISRVHLNRADLRFPFPDGFVEALEGKTVERVERRAKYLLFRLSSGATWLGHLGMTGAFRFLEGRFKVPSRYYEPAEGDKHDHVAVELQHPERGQLTLIYSDARRFGFMDVFTGDANSPFLAGLGPEPLGNSFNAVEMAARFKDKAAPIKAALLDQRVVAGLGNIYVSEALYRAHIRPTVAAGKLVGKSRRAINPARPAGGSGPGSPRRCDQRWRFNPSRLPRCRRGVRLLPAQLRCLRPRGPALPYGGCGGTVRRIVQSGRSSFFCPVCQKP